MTLPLAMLWPAVIRPARPRLQFIALSPCFHIDHALQLFYAFHRNNLVPITFLDYRAFRNFLLQRNLLA
jgi:hypothetical protein